MTPGEARDSIRTHLARGAPWDACDAFRVVAASIAAIDGRNQGLA